MIGILEQEQQQKEEESTRPQYQHTKQTSPQPKFGTPCLQKESLLRRRRVGPQQRTMRVGI